MTGLDPYGLVVVVTAPLLIAIMYAARDEERRAAWAWTPPTPGSYDLAPAASLASFALRHATLAPSAVAPVVAAYCAQARFLISEMRIRQRLDEALTERIRAGATRPRAGSGVLAARLLVLSLAVSCAVRLRWWSTLAARDRDLHAIAHEVEGLVDQGAERAEGSPRGVDRATLHALRRRMLLR